MKSNLLEDRIIKFAARCVKVCGVLPVRKVGSSSLAEARTWLKIVAESEYVTKSRMADVIQESEELAAILGASITTARKNMVTPTLA